jgi:hypothetical protein
MIVYWDFYGQPGMNVFGIRLAGGASVDQSAANAAGAAVINAHQQASLAPQNDIRDVNAIITGVGLRDIRTANQAVITASPFSPIAGNVAGDGEPANVAVVVTHRTALAGRRYRGRSFITGWTEGAVKENGALVGDATEWARIFCETLRTSIQPGGNLNGQLAVISRPNDDLSPPWPGACTPVTSCVIRSPIMGSQRRRLPPRR